jgi:hypothetical protein
MKRKRNEPITASEATDIHKLRETDHVFVNVFICNSCLNKGLAAVANEEQIDQRGTTRQSNNKSNKKFKVPRGGNIPPMRSAHTIDENITIEGRKYELIFISYRPEGHFFGQGRIYINGKWRWFKYDDLSHDGFAYFNEDGKCDKTWGEKDIYILTYMYIREDDFEPNRSLVTSIERKGPLTAAKKKSMPTWFRWHKSISDRHNSVTKVSPLEREGIMMYPKTDSDITEKSYI